MLTDLHGARAFRQFITTSKPGATIPEVLSTAQCHILARLLVSHHHRHFFLLMLLDLFVRPGAHQVHLHRAQWAPGEADSFRSS